MLITLFLSWSQTAAFKQGILSLITKRKSLFRIRKKILSSYSLLVSFDVVLTSSTNQFSNIEAFQTFSSQLKQFNPKALSVITGLTNPRLSDLEYTSKL